jgi:hypothetical protein
MNITEILARSGGLQSMARELGIDENQAAAGAEALLPAILGGFKKQTQARPGGVEDLGGLLGKLGGGSLLDDVLSPQPTNVARGNDVLGQVFGSKDVSRAVAQNASASTGLDPSVLKKMLPMLAMMVAGLMARQSGVGSAPSASTQPGSTGGLGGVLGDLLGRQESAGGTSGGGLGGIASMLDFDRDGNPLDDILRMVGKARR